MIVYLDGEYLPENEARVSVNDRGFLFADGIYEVIRVRDGKSVAMREHLERMAQGLDTLLIALDDPGRLAAVGAELLEKNDLLSGDVTIYIQVTRGSAPRKHAFPDPSTKPTVFMATRPYKRHPDAYFEDGVSAITVGDDRWARCDVKSISLLPNVLANQLAHKAGAFEALFVRDGIVLEGSHSNLFAVYDGKLVTYPASNYILNGITRMQVFDFARELGIPAAEGMIPLARLWEAEELFLSGTTTEIMPIVSVDGREILDGEPGPITHKLLERYRAMVG